jgi:hypothetical protein
MGSVLRLFLAEEDADPERLDTLTRYLRADLVDLDVEDVCPLPADTIPPGARSGIAAVVGGLLVNLGDAVGASDGGVRSRRVAKEERCSGPHGAG